MSFLYLQPQTLHDILEGTLIDRPQGMRSSIGAAIRKLATWRGFYVAMAKPFA